MKSNPVVHFEMPAEDRKRMADFYEKTFGWKCHILDEDMGGYVMVQTTASDEKTGRPTSPGVINGGFYQRQSGKSDQVPSVVIAVDDVHASIKEITTHGGTILSGPDEIPTVGLYVSFRDTEGNRVTLLQPK